MISYRLLLAVFFFMSISECKAMEKDSDIEMTSIVKQGDKNQSETNFYELLIETISTRNVERLKALVSEINASNWNLSWDSSYGFLAKALGTRDYEFVECMLSINTLRKRVMGESDLYRWAEGDSRMFELFVKNGIKPPDLKEFTPTLAVLSQGRHSDRQKWWGDVNIESYDGKYTYDDLFGLENQ